MVNANGTSSLANGDDGSSVVQTIVTSSTDNKGTLVESVDVSLAVTTESEERSSSPTGSDSWRIPNDRLIRANDMLESGMTPKEILLNLFPSLQQPPDGWSDGCIMGILAELLEQPNKRNKLPQYNTFEDAISLFRNSRRILLLTGAGVSVSCGIPDFRSKDGIYARLHEDFPDLPDPTAMFDIDYFKRNPAPFFDFAKEIFPGQFEPSISHKFIKCLEDSDQLLRNYTQNIDTLEFQTGITRVVECHGSFSKATCLKCMAKFEGDVIKEDVLAKRVSKCPKCKIGVIKPDIVFFGEDLGENFHRQITVDKDNVDLLVVIGSSLKVRPVSLIPFSVDPSVPQILINREPLNHYTADIELLGNCDEIVSDICLALGGQFTDMLKSHDQRIQQRTAPTTTSILPPTVPTTSSIPVERKRRRVIAEEEFAQMMRNIDEVETAKYSESNGDEVKEEGESSSARLEEVEGEPSVKRPRLADLYQRKYVSVEEQLPEGSYFMVSSNRSVFPGAELHFDLENQCTTRIARTYHRASGPSYNSDGELEYEGEGEWESESEGDTETVTSRSRHGSEPPVTCSSDIECAIRSGSCEPSFDLEDRISALEMKRRTTIEEEEVEE